MEDKILLLIQLGLEILRLYIGMGLIFGFEIKRKWFAILSYCLFGVLLFTRWIAFDNMRIIMLGIVFILYFIGLKTPVEKDWRWKLFCGFILLMQVEIIGVILDALPLAWKNLSFREQECVGSAIALVTLGLIGYYYKKCQSYLGNMIEFHAVHKTMIPLVVFVTVEIVSEIVYLNVVAADSGNIKDRMIASILSLLTMISVCILFAVIIYMKNANEQIEYMLGLEHKMKMLEMEHYETLLKKEENTKRYRHDVMNHLIRLEELIKNKETADAGRYVGEMIGNIQQIRNSNYDVGNKTINTILNYYVAQLDEKVNVNISGISSGKIDASEYDIITIFSNLFKNAVEAINISECKEPMLGVCVKEGQTFVAVEIRNSMKANGISYEKSGNLQTTKEDKDNHGIGLLNVKDTIRKNKGIFECDIAENQYCCCVSLRVVNEECK